MNKSYTYERNMYIVARKVNETSLLINNGQYDVRKGTAGSNIKHALRFLLIWFSFNFNYICARRGGNLLVVLLQLRHSDEGFKKRNNFIH